MKKKIASILVNESTPVAVEKIANIIASQKRKTLMAHGYTIFFAVIFIGWYCIHASFECAYNKPKCCAEKDSIIVCKNVEINYLQQLNDSAVYFKDIK